VDEFGYDWVDGVRLTALVDSFVRVPAGGDEAEGDVSFKVDVDAFKHSYGEYDDAARIARAVRRAEEKLGAHPSWVIEHAQLPNSQKMMRYCARLLGFDTSVDEHWQPKQPPLLTADEEEGGEAGRLRAQLEGNRGELSAVGAKLAALQQELLQVRLERDDLKQRLVSERQENQENQTEHTRVVGELEEALAEGSRLQQQEKDREAALDLQNQAVSQLSAQLELAQAQLVERTRQLQQATSRAAAYDELEQGSASMKSTLEAKEAEIAVLRGELDQGSASMESTLEAKEAEIAVLQDERERQAQSEQQLREELTVYKQHKEDETNKLKTDVTTYAKALQVLEERASENTELKEAKDQLQTQLMQLQASNHEQQTRIESLFAELQASEHARLTLKVDATAAPSSPPSPTPASPRSMLSSSTPTYCSDETSSPAEACDLSLVEACLLYLYGNLGSLVEFVSRDKTVDRKVLVRVEKQIEQLDPSVATQTTIQAVVELHAELTGYVKRYRCPPARSTRSFPAPRAAPRAVAVARVPSARVRTAPRASPRAAAVATVPSARVRTTPLRPFLRKKREPAQTPPKTKKKKVFGFGSSQPKASFDLPPGHLQLAASGSASASPAPTPQSARRTLKAGTFPSRARSRPRTARSTTPQLRVREIDTIDPRTGYRKKDVPPNADGRPGWE
jgi:hypothetical protein